VVVVHHVIVVVLSDKLKLYAIMTPGVILSEKLKRYAVMTPSDFRLNQK